MAGSSSIHEDGSALSRTDRLLFKLETLLALTGGITILALMLMAVAQIFGRKLFNLPVPGFIDLVEQAMAIFAFLGIAYCQRLGGHIRMDILVGSLRKRPLWAAEFLSALVMLVLSVFLTYGSWLHFKRAFDIGDSSIDIAIPLWPAKLLVPVALAILSLRLAIQLWGYGRAFVRNEEEPVAVPLVESAAVQARKEAEHVSGLEDEKRRTPVEPLEIGIWLSGLLVVLVVLGVRVAFAAAFIGFAGLVAIFAQKFGFEKGLTVATSIAGTVPHSKATTYALSLIPTFILIGYLAYYAGLTKAIFEAAKRWLGWLPGGLGVATVFATAGFAAVSGASVATSAVFARIAIPEMLKEGYDRRFAAGVVAAGGTLASLIPPSAILVIYAIIVEQSVGALLLAGFLPGAVSALIYGGLVVGMATFRKDLGPPVSGFTWKERFETIPGAFPIMFVVFIIIYCIYGGWGTPTEAGALGAFVVLVMAFKRGMKWDQLKDSLLESAKLTVMIFTIIWGVLIYVRFLGFADLPGAFSEFIGGLDQPRIVTLLLILSAYAILGMFMDAIGMLLLTLPVVFPAVMQLGYDPIWFGIIVVKMAELCLITPPIGLNCFVVAGVRPDISVQDVFRGASPFFVADVVTIAVLIAFPEIVLWLPNLMLG